MRESTARLNDAQVKLTELIKSAPDGAERSALKSAMIRAGQLTTSLGRRALIAMRAAGRPFLILLAGPIGFGMAIADYVGAWEAVPAGETPEEYARFKERASGLNCGQDFDKACQEMVLSCQLETWVVKSILPRDVPSGPEATGPGRAAKGWQNGLDWYLYDIDREVRRCAGEYLSQAPGFYASIPYTGSEMQRVCESQMSRVISQSLYVFAAHNFLFRELAKSEMASARGLESDPRSGPEGLRRAASHRDAATTYSNMAARISIRAAAMASETEGRAGCDSTLNSFPDWTEPNWHGSAPMPPPPPPAPGSTTTPKKKLLLRKTRTRKSKRHEVKACTAKKRRAHHCRSRKTKVKRRS